MFTMVRNYIRKTDRQKWDVKSMEMAIQTVISDVFSDADFLPSATTYIRLETDEYLSANTSKDNVDLLSQSSQASTKPASKKAKSSRNLDPEPRGCWIILRESHLLSETRQLFQNGLQESITEKEEKEKEKERKKQEKYETKSGKLKSIAIKLFGNDKTKKNKPGKKEIKEKNKTIIEGESDSDVDEADCLYCGDFYSTSNEGWVACIKILNA
ncbi:hypothetical protein J6590_061997 [Homalodisca vitripennis]|nr:hypothetical protein J6590_061997 [Homalodisca vitripennis]